MDNKNEMLPIVDENGNVIGKMRREEAHDGSKKLHPVVHLHVFSPNGDIYLQKRSEWKDVQPGKWDTAVGGHVDYGESILEALYRESSEELGLVEFNPVWLCSYEFESGIEREQINVFAAVGSYVMTPDHDEVEEIRGWTMDAISGNLGKSVFTPNFEQEFARIRASLEAML